MPLHIGCKNLKISHVDLFPPELCPVLSKILSLHMLLITHYIIFVETITLKKLPKCIESESEVAQ